MNTKIDDGSDIAELMHIFTDLNAYDFEKFPKVSKRKKQFKEAADSARKLFENGVNYEIVRTSISTISDEDLQKIYSQVTGNRF